MVKFPYYSGNIKNADAVGHLTLEKFIDRHKHPKPSVKNLIQLINEASLAGRIEWKKRLKRKLFAFTPSVFIETGKPRRYENIISWTGLMQLDFDGLKNKEDAIELKNHLFNEYESIVCSYLSPSGLGVKCLMKITVPDDIDHYRAIFKAVEAEMEQYGWMDSATKNAILPLFLSVDEDILYRDFETVKCWDKEDWSKTSYVRLNDAPTNFNLSDKQRDYNEQKTIRIATKKMNEITNDGHPQVRSTALILGSRCGAGYINRNDAESLMISLIYSNSYLQKDIKNYIKTAIWGIDQGMSSPKFY